MSRDSLHEQVMQVLREQYEIFDKRNEVEIGPAMLADAVMRQIDPNHSTPVLPSYLSRMRVREMARTFLRTNYEKPEALNHEMFNGLQRRYPARRNSEHMYVLRESLTLGERLQNIARLRKVSVTAGEHAAALSAETEEMRKAGRFLNDDGAIDNE